MSISRTDGGDTLGCRLPSWRRHLGVPLYRRWGPRRDPMVVCRREIFNDNGSQVSAYVLAAPSTSSVVKLDANYVSCLIAAGMIVKCLSPRWFSGGQISPHYIIMFGFSGWKPCLLIRLMMIACQCRGSSSRHHLRDPYGVLTSRVMVSSLNAWLPSRGHIVLIIDAVREHKVYLFGEQRLWRSLRHCCRDWMAWR
jgi:hypothetical protein